jgi:hypothetical protein
MLNGAIKEPRNISAVRESRSSGDRMFSGNRMGTVLHERDKFRQGTNGAGAVAFQVPSFLGHSAANVTSARAVLSSRAGLQRQTGRRGSILKKIAATWPCMRCNDSPRRQSRSRLPTRHCFRPGSPPAKGHIVRRGTEPCMQTRYWRCPQERLPRCPLDRPRE